MLEFTEEVPNMWTGGTAVLIANEPAVNNIGGWTLPDGTPGAGIPDAVTRWAQVWMEQ